MTKTNEELAFEAGIQELKDLKMGHLTYNTAIQLYRGGFLKGEIKDLVIDLHCASPHTGSVDMPTKRKAQRDLMRRYGLWPMLPNGPQRVDAYNLGVRMADGEFEQVTFIFHVANTGFPPLSFTLHDDGTSGEAVEIVGRMLGQESDAEYEVDIEHWDGNLYLMVGLHKPEGNGGSAYLNICHICGSKMYTDEFAQGDGAGHEIVSLSCHNCGAKVTIVAEPGDDEYEEEIDYD